MPIMTPEEYEAIKAAVRAAPEWRPHGDPNCGDCLSMSHCETHFKIEETYPDDSAIADDLYINSTGKDY